MLGEGEWLEVVTRDMRCIGVTEWGTVTQNRSQWRIIVKAIEENIR